MSYTDAVGLFRRFIPALARPHCLSLAMNRSHSMPGALALVATFFALFAVTAAPARAVEPLPDARMLSAAPFTFHADREIFLRMPAAPSDSRIFKPVDPIRSASASRLPQTRFKPRPMI